MADRANLSSPSTRIKQESSQVKRGAFCIWDIIVELVQFQEILLLTPLDITAHSGLSEMVVRDNVEQN